MANIYHKEDVYMYIYKYSIVYFVGKFLTKGKVKDQNLDKTLVRCIKVDI